MHSNYVIIRNYTMPYIIITLLCCLKLRGLSHFLISFLLFLILTPNLLADLSEWLLLYIFASQLKCCGWTELCRLVSFAYEFYMQKMLSWENLFFPCFQTNLLCRYSHCLPFLKWICTAERIPLQNKYLPAIFLCEYRDLQCSNMGLLTCCFLERNFNLL